MEHKGKEVENNKEEQGLGEQAINKRETDGVVINQQQKQRREKHQPRNNA